jgi:hypothetical protein
VITPSIWPTPTGRDWKDGSAKACANIPVNGLLGACAHCKYLNFCNSGSAMGGERTVAEALLNGEVAPIPDAHRGEAPRTSSTNSGPYGRGKVVAEVTSSVRNVYPAMLLMFPKA